MARYHERQNEIRQLVRERYGFVCVSVIEKRSCLHKIVCRFRTMWGGRLLLASENLRRQRGHYYTTRTCRIDQVEEMLDRLAAKDAAERLRADSLVATPSAAHQLYTAPGTYAGSVPVWNGHSWEIKQLP